MPLSSYSSSGSRGPIECRRDEPPPDGRRAVWCSQRRSLDRLPSRDWPRRQLGRGARQPRRRDDRARRARPRRADHVGAGREHLPRPDVRPELRIPGGGPVPRRADGRRIRRGDAGRRGQRHHQALSGQQLGGRSPPHQLRHRRAHHARDLPAGVRGRRQRGARRRAHDLVQPGERPPHDGERRAGRRPGQEGVGIRRRRHVRLGRDLRRRRRRQRRPRHRDALGEVHEPRDAAARHQGRPGLAGDDRRQGPADPAHRHPLRLARSPRRRRQRLAL